MLDIFAIYKDELVYKEHYILLKKYLAFCNKYKITLYYIKYINFCLVSCIICLPSIKVTYNYKTLQCTAVFKLYKKLEFLK